MATDSRVFLYPGNLTKTWSGSVLFVILFQVRIRNRPKYPEADQQHWFLVQNMCFVVQNMCFGLVFSLSIWFQWIEEASTIYPIVGISDGNSEIGAHKRSNLCYLICFKYLIRSRAGTNRIFKSENTFFPSEFWPSNMSTMDFNGRSINYLPPLDLFIQTDQLI